MFVWKVLFNSQPGFLLFLSVDRFQRPRLSSRGVATGERGEAFWLSRGVGLEQWQRQEEIRRGPSKAQSEQTNL